MKNSGISYKSYGICLLGLVLLVRLFSCSNEDKELSVPEEKLLIIESGVWLCSIKSDLDPILIMFMHFDSTFSGTTGSDIKFQELNGTFFLTDSVCKIAPIIDHSIEYGHYEYISARRGNSLILKYLEYVPIDTLDPTYYNFNEEVFERDIKFEVVEYNSEIQLHDSLLKIDLIKLIE